MLVCVAECIQSGTGKTYTMWGPLGAMVDSGSDHADRGIVPRVFQNLFSRIQGVRNSSPVHYIFENCEDHVSAGADPDNSPEKQISYQCRCSFLEVCSTIRLFSAVPCLRMVSGTDIRNEIHA